MQGFRTLGQGESVEFHITSDRDGLTEAVDVTRLEEGPFQGNRGGGGASGRVGRGGTGGGGGYSGVGRGKGGYGGYGDLGHMARDCLQGVSGSVGGSGGSESGGGGVSGGSNQCGSGRGDDPSKPSYAEVAAGSQLIPVRSLNSLGNMRTFEQLLAEHSPWKDPHNEGPISRKYQLVFRTLTGSISELEEKKGITHGFLEPKDITITGALMRIKWLCC